MTVVPLVQIGAGIVPHLPSTNRQSAHEATVLANGNIVFCWEDGDFSSGSFLPDLSIKYRIFSKDLVPLTGELSADRTWPDLQSAPSISALSDGGFVMSWTAYVADEGTNAIFLREFKANGQPAGDVIRVNASTAGAEHNSNITGLADGGWVVTWTDSHPREGVSFSVSEVWYARYDAAGTPVTAPGPLTPIMGPTFQGSDCTVACPDGGWFTVWAGRIFEISVGISMARFNALGERIGDIIEVSGQSLVSDPNPLGTWFHPSMALLADGGWVVVWYGEHHDGLRPEWDYDSDVYMQRFAADGTKVGGEVRVNPIEHFHQEQPAVVATPDGGWLVVWADETFYNTDGLAQMTDQFLYAQRYAASGAKLGGPVVLFDDFAGDRNAPKLTILNDGTFLVSGFAFNFQSATSGADIIAANIAAPFNGTSNGDEIQGTTGRDIVFALGGADLVRGGDGDDFLFGDRGGDRLEGGAGVDVLAGEDGNDTLEGGAGADLIAGGLGIDTADYVGSNAGVRIVLATGVASGGDATDDVLTSIERLSGSLFDDTLGGDGGANVLSGQDGNDILRGDAGDDVLNGGAGSDTALFVGTVDTTVRLATGTAQLTGHGFDRLIGIENVTSAGGQDLLVGNGAENTLNAGAGDDSLYGGSGNDTLYGGSGNDLLRGDAGDDVLNGGSGLDTAVFSGTVNTMVRLTTAAVQATGHGNDRLIGIENITTAGGNDRLTGNGAANILNAGAGDDSLYGGSGNDTLYGGSGNDLLRGDAGDDVLNGGSGIDTFEFRSGCGLDQIIGFANDVDVIRLDDAIWGGGLTAAEVVSTFGSVVGGSCVLDFGGGNTISFAGFTNISDLADDLILF